MMSISFPSTTHKNHNQRKSFVLNNNGGGGREGERGEGREVLKWASGGDVGKQASQQAPFTINQLRAVCTQLENMHQIVIGGQGFCAGELKGR